MVNRAVPAEIKRKRGTLRKDRAGGGDSAVAIRSANLPAPPSLETAGRAEWERTMKTCSWVSESDVGALTIQCELLDRRDDILQELSGSDLVLETSTGYLYSHPLLKDLLKVEDMLAKWTSLLGKTPSDRSRLSIAEVKQASKLDELSSRRAGRKASAPAAKKKSKSRRRAVPTATAAPTGV